MTLAYSAPFTIVESAANLGGFRVFRLNSIYDPDLTGIGSSAAGLAQMGTMFSNYRVHATRVRLEGYYGPGTNGDQAALVGFAPLANQTVLPANPNNWRLLPMSKHRLITNVAFGGANRIDVSSQFNLARLARITKMQYNTDFDYSGTTGSNPLRPLNLFVFIVTPGGAAPGTFYCTVTIAYEVEFFNPLPMTAN